MEAFLLADLLSPARYFLLWGRWECWYSSSYFRVTRLGNGLLLLRRKCDIAAKPPH